MAKTTEVVRRVFARTPYAVIISAVFDIGFASMHFFISRKPVAIPFVLIISGYVLYTFLQAFICFILKEKRGGFKSGEWFCIGAFISFLMYFCL